jgi:pSer/pThr/pTyr-binding forkhead associated (FHA) protein/S1-C subfamily serine protease
MSVEFRITTGARAGASERFEKSVVSIGRHPMNDLRFDANKDIDVSGRHAELRSVGGRHVLHDIGSTNGTFVNGDRITERELADGDVVTFGAGGPQVSFHVVSTASAPSPATRVDSADRPAPANPGPVRTTAAPHAAKPESPKAPAAKAPEAKPRLNTEVRVAIAVEKQTGKLRQMVIALGALVVVGGVGAAWVLSKQADLAQQQVAALLAANDSLSRSFEARLRATGIADAALSAARAERDSLDKALRAQQAAGADVSALSAAMRSSQQRTASLAGTDYAAIAEANKPAIVFIAVKMPDGSPSSGTGFNILPSGLIVTNRHVVQASNGAQATRVGVIFEGRQGEWREARIEYVSETDELALLRLVTPGNHPIVSGIAGDAGSVRLASPIAILGYPLGTGTAGMGGDINTLKPVATMNIGTVSKVLDDNVQLDVYAAPGSSGSPVFDSRGLVIGVLYGAARESEGRIIYSVPSSRLAKQLPADAAGVIR